MILDPCLLVRFDSLKIGDQFLLKDGRLTVWEKVSTSSAMHGNAVRRECSTGYMVYKLEEGEYD